MAKQYLMPYTNLHELNLDWLINAMKQLEASWNDLEMKATATVETTASNPQVVVSGSLKDTLNFDFKLPQGTAFPSKDVPLMDQKQGAVGISEQFARGDHVHPSDTSKVNKIVPSTSATYFYCQDTENTFLTPVQEYVLQGELENAVKVKQDTLVSGSNIKTIDNISLLGEGNIATDKEINFVTLWENSAPSEAFGAQTIPVTYAENDIFYITFGRSSSDHTIIYGFLIKMNNGVKYYFNGITGGLLLARLISITSTGIAFADNTQYASYATASTDNTRMIPQTIYRVEVK